MITVCITAQDDGQYKVWVEQADEAAGEAPEGAEPGQPPAATPPAAPMAPAGAPPAEGAEATEEANEPGAQVVGSIKEALTLALEALKNDGNMNAANDQANAFNAAATGKPAGAM